MVNWNCVVSTWCCTDLFSCVVGSETGATVKSVRGTCFDVIIVCFTWIFHSMIRCGEKSWVGGLESCWSCDSCYLFMAVAGTIVVCDMIHWSCQPMNKNSFRSKVHDDRKKLLWPQNMWSKAALHILGPLHKTMSHDRFILQWPRDMQCFERLEKEFQKKSWKRSITGSMRALWRGLGRDALMQIEVCSG